MTTCSNPHVALFPSAGMGHLTPFLRLAAALSSRGCLVTIFTAQPTVSVAESNHITAFLHSHPSIMQQHINLLPYESNAATGHQDPFFKQFDAIRSSLHLLGPLLESPVQPFSALVSDILLSDRLAEVVFHILPPVPKYVLCTSSARFLSLMSRLTVLLSESGSLSLLEEIEIDTAAEVVPVPRSSVPPVFSDTKHPFSALLTANTKSFPLFDGILVNTFHDLEPRAIEALNTGRVSHSLPPILAIGPLLPVDDDLQANKQEELLLQLLNQNKSNMVVDWLDAQPPSSVVLLSFGSRTAMSKDQIAEIAKALHITECRFVWILKGSKVDKDDNFDVMDLIGQQLLREIENRGLVIKEWVNQQLILSHQAIGGFVSHCGWNSVTEASARGVPVLALPLHGDQKLNAEVVVEAGLGIWERSWGWFGERVIMAEEIGPKLVELMQDAALGRSAASVGQNATRAVDHGGSSDVVLKRFVEKLTI